MLSARVIFNFVFLCEIGSVVRAVPVPDPDQRGAGQQRSGRARRDVGRVRFRIKGIERGMLEGN